MSVYQKTLILDTLSPPPLSRSFSLSLTLSIPLNNTFIFSNSITDRLECALATPGSNKALNQMQLAHIVLA